MIRIRFIAIIVIVLISSCFPKTVPYNPFKVTQEEFFSKIKTVALAPFIVPGDLENKEHLKTKFETLVESKLHEAGFVVIPSREYGETWERMTKQMGGYFDAVTGKRDESKFKTVKEYTLREMRAKFNADAILYSGIRVVTVPFSRDTASWHGTSEDLTSGFFSTLLVSHHGIVPAISLSVLVDDYNGIDMYFNMGGIQLLEKLSGGKLVAIPDSEILTSEERNAGAVNIALDPLVRKTTPEFGAKP